MPSENTVSRSPEDSLSMSHKTMKAALKGLLTLAILYTLFLAKTLLLPFIIAAFLALFCNPLVSFLHRHWVPKVVAALLIMASITGFLIGTITLLAQPAEKWVAAIPYATAEISAQLDEVTKNPAAPPSEKTPSGEKESGSVAQQMHDRFFSTIISFALNSTPVLLTQILAVIILVYFFLVYSKGILRKLISICPAMAEKRVVVIIVRTIQTDVSYYILVVAIINAALGIATSLALWAIGVRDPALWGAMAALLNFAPYLGPFVMTITLSFVGLIQFGVTPYALLVPLTFLALNFIECQIVTPTALGNRLRLNPLIVFVWLLLWGWMWGAAGMLVGVPLLVCVKIIAVHLHSFDPWIKLLER
jgi:predicted PurR-regulated permease PerM